MQNGSCHPLLSRPGTLNEFRTRALRSCLCRAWKLCEIMYPADYPQRVCSLAQLHEAHGVIPGSLTHGSVQGKRPNWGTASCLSCRTLFKYCCPEIWLAWGPVSGHLTWVLARWTLASLVGGAEVGGGHAGPEGGVGHAGDSGHGSGAQVPRRQQCWPPVGDIEAEPGVCDLLLHLLPQVLRL